MLIKRLLQHFKIILLFICLALAEGKKRRNTHGDPSDEGESPPIENLCDIVSPVIIYCYCNTVDPDMANEGNCWIFNDTSEDKFKNVWEGFSTQTKIKHLTLHLRPDGTLKEIPTVAIRHLPDLEWFEVQYATISTAHTFSFGNSTSIKKISLARNGIEVLQPYALANLISLERITLGENHLTQIKRKVFSNLPQLKTLYIDRNNITSIEDFAFVELKALKELELFSNQIKAIVPETFKGLYALERLDLNKNWIEVLGDSTFQDLKNLKTLDLKGNSIKYIAPKSFYGLNKLQKLVLQDNKLMSLGPDVFKHVQNLLYLDLRQNVLETLLKETVYPLMSNFNGEGMQIFLEGNVFRCDTRLLWIFSLFNSTKDSNLKKNLQTVVCYLESGSLPPRFNGVDPTPAYEITTMGIGPRIELLNLLPSELPDPLLKTQATLTHEECDDEDDHTTKVTSTSGHKHRGRGHGGRIRGRGKGRKHHRSTTPVPQQEENEQNDMASSQGSVNEPQDDIGKVSIGVSRNVQPASPVQESRSHDEPSGAKRGAIATNTLLLLMFSLLTMCA